MIKAKEWQGLHKQLCLHLKMLKINKMASFIKLIGNWDLLMKKGKERQCNIILDWKIMKFEELIKRRWLFRRSMIFYCKKLLKYKV